MILCSKNDDFTNLLKQTWRIPDKQEKTLIFQEESEKNSDRKSSTKTTDELEESAEERKRFTFVKKPLPTSQPYQSFFQKIMIDETESRVMIWIWLYFHEEAIKKYLLPEIEGKTTWMCDGLLR